MIALDLALDKADLAKFRRLLVAGRTEAAKSLTFTAERAKPAWQAEDHAVFHMRNSWLDKGVRIRAATAGNLVAQVGSIDKYFERHTIGLGQPKKGEDGPLLVPLYSSIGDVLTHTRMRAKMRQMSSTKRKPFLLKLHGRTLLARRLGKERNGLSFIGVLRDAVRITPRFPAEELVAGVVRREFATVYERLLLAWAARQ